MGSFLSSAADAAPGDEFSVARVLEIKRPGHRTSKISKEEHDHDAYYSSRLIDVALKHYNSNNPGAEFDLVEPFKAACVGFRQDFWYHVNFLARRRDDTPDNDSAALLFFAELRLVRHPRFRRLIVETCTILEKPLCRYRSRCAFCPDKFETLHPSDGEFVCGKKRQRKKFFMERDILSRPFTEGGFSCVVAG